MNIQTRKDSEEIAYPLFEMLSIIEFIGEMAIAVPLRVGIQFSLMMYHSHSQLPLANKETQTHQTMVKPRKSEREGKHEIGRGEVGLMMCIIRQYENASNRRDNCNALSIPLLSTNRPFPHHEQMLIRG